MKKILVVIFTMILAVSLIGCGTKKRFEEKIGEAITEKIFEEAGGVDVDISGEEITFSTEEGESIIFGKTEWPTSNCELAKKNADVVAIDCCKSSIEYSTEQARINCLEIQHFVRNSNDLYGIDDSTFDIVLCSMILMDCEDLEGTIKEVERVLKPSGILFASVLHPCFDGNHSDGIGRQGTGIDRQVVVKNYFSPSQWEAPLNKGKTSVIWRHRTLEEYVKVFIKCGLTIIDLNEPRPSDEQAKISTSIAWLQKMNYITYSDLFTFVLLIIALLTYINNRDNKQKK